MYSSLRSPLIHAVGAGYSYISLSFFSSLTIFRSIPHAPLTSSLITSVYFMFTLLVPQFLVTLISSVFLIISFLFLFLTRLNHILFSQLCSLLLNFLAQIHSRFNSTWPNHISTLVFSVLKLLFLFVLYGNTNRKLHK